MNRRLDHTETGPGALAEPEDLFEFEAAPGAGPDEAALEEARAFSQIEAVDLEAESRPAGARRRATPAQYLGEVRSELRRVAWPTRGEVVNYSSVVLLTLVLLVALIFLLNYGFSKAVMYLFGA